MKRSFGITPLLFPELGQNPDDPWQTTAAGGAQACDQASLTTLELCAGAGGQALGLEQAGIEHCALVEVNAHACATLRTNRPHWNVIETDVNTFDGNAYKGVDILSGGLPCPPFSVAGKQLGKDDDRNLFPALLRLADQVRPRALMIENVRGFLDPVFAEYRSYIKSELLKLGYQTGWRLMNASDFGVPQLRPRVALIALRKELSEHFEWPGSREASSVTVGAVLGDLMGANGWPGAADWARQANRAAPTIVGGSHKHGGPDLGPTRARKAWAELGVDGLGVVEEAPGPDFKGMPRLTVRMVARLQGFPDTWQFSGPRTHAYRQVGNAFPPPFARAIAQQLKACLTVPRLVRIAG